MIEQAQNGGNDSSSTHSQSPQEKMVAQSNATPQDNVSTRLCSFSNTLNLRFAMPWIERLG